MICNHTHEISRFWFLFMEIYMSECSNVKMIFIRNSNQKEKNEWNNCFSHSIYIQLNRIKLINKWHCNQLIFQISNKNTGWKMIKKKIIRFRLNRTIAYDFSLCRLPMNAWFIFIKKSWKLWIQNYTIERSEATQQTETKEE